MGRPRKQNQKLVNSALGLNTDNFEITTGETLTGKDFEDFTADVLRGRFDPIWFMEEKLGWVPFPKQEEIIREFYRDKYNPSFPKYKKLIGRIGQRGGKSATGGKIATYEFFELATCSFTKTPAEHYGLMKGQQIGISCVSAGKEQAMIGIFNFMKIDIDDNEWFNQWFDVNVIENKIEIKEKNIYATVSAAKADSGAGTGTTSKAIFGDEVDLWQRTDSKVGAEIVWSKLVNSTQTLGDDGKCIAISSTQYPDGMITKLYNAGLKERKTLVYDLPTWEMNPRIKKEDLMEEFRYRMEQFYRDFANQPNVSGGLQFPERVKLDKSITNVLQVDYELLGIKPRNREMIPHVMAIDPAWRNDAFGIGCGYMSKSGRPIIDGVRKFQKTNKDESFIKPSDIRNFVVPAINHLNVDTFLYDTDLAPELVEYIDDEMGVDVIKHIVLKEDYDRWRELQDADEVSVVYDEYLENEANQLIVQITDSGRRKTNHTAYSSKDVSDTVANCIWYLKSDETFTETKFTPLGPMVFV